MAKQTKTTKSVVKPAVSVQHECNCEHGCPCGCHKHGVAHIFKHILILAIVFALGMVCGKMLCFGPAKHNPMQHRMHPVFTNGCLDMQSIECPKMQEALQKADVNGDDCISIEEYKAAKPKKQNMQSDKQNRKAKMHEGRKSRKSKKSEK